MKSVIKFISCNFLILGGYQSLGRGSSDHPCNAPADCLGGLITGGFSWCTLYGNILWYAGNHLPWSLLPLQPHIPSRVMVFLGYLLYWWCFVLCQVVCDDEFHPQI